MDVPVKMYFRDKMSEMAARQAARMGQQIEIDEALAHYDRLPLQPTQNLGRQAG